MQKSVNSFASMAASEDGTVVVLAEKKEKKVGTGLMVGGATMESLERAFERCSKKIKERENR